MRARFRLRPARVWARIIATLRLINSAEASRAPAPDSCCCPKHFAPGTEFGLIPRTKGAYHPADGHHAPPVSARFSFLAALHQGARMARRVARAPSRGDLVVPAVAALARRLPMDMVLQGIADWPRAAHGGGRLLARRLLCDLGGRGRRAAGRCCSIRPCTRRATWPATSASRRPGTIPAEHFYFEPRFVDELRALERGPRRGPGALLRRDRQGRRGAGLARNDGPLSRRADQAAGRRRPRAVRFRPAHRRSAGLSAASA